MVNKVVLVGRLGRDPEVKEFNDKKVCNFSVATTNGFGENQTTEWHNIQAWDKLATICGDYLTKGSLVYIEGRIKNSSYEKDGVKKYKSEVVAYTMQMLGEKKKRDEADVPNAAADVPF